MAGAAETCSIWTSRSRDGGRTQRREDTSPRADPSRRAATLVAPPASSRKIQAWAWPSARDGDLSRRLATKSWASSRRCPGAADPRRPRPRQSMWGVADHRGAERRPARAGTLQPQEGRPGNVRAPHCRDPAASTPPDHDPGPRRPAAPRPAESGVHCWMPNRRHVGDITYLPCGDDGFLYLATVIRLLLPPPGRLVHHRPHAHQPGQWPAPRGSPAAWISGWCRVPQLPQRPRPQRTTPRLAVSSAWPAPWPDFGFGGH
jgi:hypothetical protein